MKITLTKNHAGTLLYILLSISCRLLFVQSYVCAEGLEITGVQLSTLPTLK